MNIVAHVEIPVVDIVRAMRFYGAVFGMVFDDIVTIHGNRMAFVPFKQGKEGASFALAQGEIYVPSREGVVVYLAVKDIDAILDAVGFHGGHALFPKTAVSETCYVAEFCDSEGNRIAIQAM